MERYTYFSDGKWRVKIGQREYYGPVANRLAAYEDLGIPPNQIKEWLIFFKVILENNPGGQPRTKEELLRDLPWRSMLKISARTAQYLSEYRKNGKTPLLTIGDVADLSKDEIYKIHSVGRETRKEIARKLQDLGVTQSDWLDFLPTQDQNNESNATTPTQPEKR